MRKDPNEIPLPHPDKTETSKQVEPFLLWPLNKAPNLGKSAVAQVPAAPFEPIFGETWAPNKPVPGGWNPKYPLTEGLAPGVTSIAQHLGRMEAHKRSLETPAPAAAPEGAPVPAATVPAGATAAANAASGSNALLQDAPLKHVIAEEPEDVVAPAPGPGGPKPGVNTAPAYEGLLPEDPYPGAAPEREVPESDDAAPTPAP